MSAQMFSLTELTGREASAHRTVVIGTVEMNWRVWMVLLWTLPLALMVTAVLFVFAGSAALLAIPLVEGGAIYLIHRRTRSGLKLRTYQAIWDRKRSTVDAFFICGQPIDLSQDRFVSLIGSTVPNPNFVPAIVDGQNPTGPDASQGPRQARSNRSAPQVPQTQAPQALVHSSVDDLFGAA